MCKAEIRFEHCTPWSDFSKTHLSNVYPHVQVQMDVCNRIKQLNITEKVWSVSKNLITYIWNKDTVIGRRNFPSLESLLKQKICPRNILGHFKSKIRPKCFDETGPCSPLENLISANLSPLRKHAYVIYCIFSWL